MIGRPRTACFGPAVRASVACARRGVFGVGERRDVGASARLAGGLTCLAAVGLAGFGCAAASEREPLPLQEVPAFSASGDAVLPERWWTAFDDGELDLRVERALGANFNLAAAWERLLQAEAVLRRERADQQPSLDATAGAAVRDGSDVARRTELSLGLEATYEVDLWGRIESIVEAERRRAAATEADYRTAAITLSAEVALAWYRLAEARQQLALVDSQIDTNEKVLAVLRKRFEVGQTDGADVLRQRQLVESTREQRILAESRVAVLEHALAVLEGRPPQAADAEGAMPEGLPDVPARPATGLPADLLQRRPDVQAAYLRLEAADSDVAAAVADRYPRIDLTAAISTTAENPSGLFDAWLASLAGDLVAPLLDGGRREAEVERTEAVRRERLADYGAVVLDAFREVEDALAQEQDQVRRIESLERQLALSRSTLEQLRTQYRNGARDFLDVLDALREQQSLERTLLGARLERVGFRIALHRALAGGFPTPFDEARDGARATREDASADDDSDRTTSEVTRG